MLYSGVSDWTGEADQPKRTIRSEPSPLSDPETLFHEIESALYFLPEEFFTRVWVEKQLDRAERHDFLYGEIRLAVRNQGRKEVGQALFARNWSRSCRANDRATCFRATRAFPR
jgi:hypothetical protein